MGMISRDEAIVMLEDMEGRRDEDGYIRVYKSDVIANLRSLSSIDLVRCEECKYYKRDFYNIETFCIYHKWANVLTTSEQYCSHGERRSDD